MYHKPFKGKHEALIQAPRTWWHHPLMDWRSLPSLTVSVSPSWSLLSSNWTTVIVVKSLGPMTCFYIENYSLFSPSWTHICFWQATLHPHQIRALTIQDPGGSYELGEDVASTVGDLQTRWAVDLSRKGPAAKMIHPRCKHSRRSVSTLIFKIHGLKRQGQLPWMSF